MKKTSLQKIQENPKQPQFSTVRCIERRIIRNWKIKTSASRTWFLVYRNSGDLVSGCCQICKAPTVTLFLSKSGTPLSIEMQRVYKEKLGLESSSCTLTDEDKREMVYYCYIEMCFRNASDCDAVCVLRHGCNPSDQPQQYQHALGLAQLDGERQQLREHHSVGISRDNHPT